eukprot:TRINITY_DN9421_c0_g1_i2.p1 TRINITY_DN9421_c0_g1~~TRINITY_DN9421_c0_g1_i2.p1  ORF type:complete len:793 (-),score=102.98 TRINITY_DN9421_c0_g1_i2:85-2463(-)
MSCLISPKCGAPGGWPSNLARGQDYRIPVVTVHEGPSRTSIPSSHGPIAAATAAAAASAAVGSEDSPGGGSADGVAVSPRLVVASDGLPLHCRPLPSYAPTTRCISACGACGNVGARRGGSCVVPPGEGKPMAVATSGYTRPGVAVHGEAQPVVFATSPSMEMQRGGIPPGSPSTYLRPAAPLQGRLMSAPLRDRDSHSEGPRVQVQTLQDNPASRFFSARQPTTPAMNLGSPAESLVQPVNLPQGGSLRLAMGSPAAGQGKHVYFSGGSSVAPQSTSSLQPGGATDGDTNAVGRSSVAPLRTTLPQPGQTTGGDTNAVGRSSVAPLRTTLPQPGQTTGGDTNAVGRSLVAPQRTHLLQPGQTNGGDTNAGTPSFQPEGVLESVSCADSPMSNPEANIRQTFASSSPQVEETSPLVPFLAPVPEALPSTTLAFCDSAGLTPPPPAAPLVFSPRRRSKQNLRNSEPKSPKANTSPRASSPRRSSQQMAPTCTSARSRSSIQGASSPSPSRTNSTKAGLLRRSEVAASPDTPHVDTNNTSRGGSSASGATFEQRRTLRRVEKPPRASSLPKHAEGRPSASNSQFPKPSTQHWWEIPSQPREAGRRNRSGIRTLRAAQVLTQGKVERSPVSFSDGGRPEDAASGVSTSAAQASTVSASDKETYGSDLGDTLRRSEAGTGGSADDQAVLISELLRTIESWREADVEKTATKNHREEIASLQRSEAEAQRTCFELQEMCFELAAAQCQRQQLGGLVEAAEIEASAQLDRQNEEINALRCELEEVRLRHSESRREKRF